VSGTTLRVRMYRVGFGDCFLVSLLGEQPHHLLIDCGVHVRGDVQTLARVVADIEALTAGAIDLVIASHAHEDHIAGFARHADVFRRLQIGEVWLPWSEDPEDEVAIQLRRQRARLVAALEAHAAARPLSAAATAALLNLAAARNQAAMDNLRDGFGTGADVRYLESGDMLNDVGGVPGLSARLLGPPRDEAFLKKMDPPVSQRFLRLGAGHEVVAPGAVEPFRQAWTAGAAAGGPRLPGADAEALRAGAALPGDALAFALEDARNNTSLVVLFTYRGKRLLFPGDAQWGSWKYWLDQPDAADVLASLDFYKVSHHGSVNATPTAAVDGLTNGRAVAMVSTQVEPWPSIPAPRLISALGSRTGGRVARSDSVAVTGAPVGPPLDDVPLGFELGELWIDFTADV
jgi:beta-lactamase superfamily II metal-dependent hydrolase